MPKLKDYNAVREVVSDWVALGPVPKKFPAGWEGWVLAMSRAVQQEQRRLHPGREVDLNEETELGSASTLVFENLKTWLRRQSPVFKNI